MYTKRVFVAFVKAIEAFVVKQNYSVIFMAPLRGVLFVSR